MVTTIIEGKIVTGTEVFLGQIAIEQKTGLITEVAKDTGVFRQRSIGNPNYIFPENVLIFPGFGDIHIHAREDETGEQCYKEDYKTVNAAAIHGGVVHTSDMPNTKTPLTTATQLRWHQDRCKEFAVTMFHYVGIGPETRPLEEEVAYKVFTGPSVGQLFFKSEEELRNTLKHYRRKRVSFHVEDFDILEENKRQPTHAARRPVECVEKALEYVLKIIEDYELEAKLCHWPVGGRSFELIAKHRAQGYKTTLEVSPLHLYFDADMLKEKPEFWPYVQMNPALQGREHRLALIEALRSGFIQFLATDHAPHTLDEKFKQFQTEKQKVLGMTPEQYYHHLKATNMEECRWLACRDGTSGTPQLDTYGLIATWLMAEHGFTPQDIARVCAENPGYFVNHFHRGRGKFGKIEVGYYGSLTMLDTKKPTTVQREDLKTKVQWSPFENITFPGSVAATFIKGFRYN